VRVVHRNNVPRTSKEQTQNTPRTVRTTSESASKGRDQATIEQTALARVIHAIRSGRRTLTTARRPEALCGLLTAADGVDQHPPGHIWVHSLTSRGCRTSKLPKLSSSAAVLVSCVVLDESQIQGPDRGGDPKLAGRVAPVTWPNRLIFRTHILWRGASCGSISLQLFGTATLLNWMYALIR
jgi:hypothetical protein